MILTLLEKLQYLISLDFFKTSYLIGLNETEINHEVKECLLIDGFKIETINNVLGVVA